MSPGKLFFHMKLLFCLALVASEGKKRKNRNQNPEAAAQSQPRTLDPGYNICDIQAPEVIYCYCDVLYIHMAIEGNCWIFNDITGHEYIFEGFSSQTNIKRLTLHMRPDGNLNTIPTIAFQHLLLLEWFEVKHATFKSVHAYSFANSTTLMNVSLSRNSIASLSRNSFNHLPSLATLFLEENHITEVNRHVFVNLPRLTKLYMDRNNITIVHDKAFMGLHNLIELKLFSNQIKVITPDTFKGLRNLERLDLHKNRIEVIGDMTFQDLHSLRILDLHENYLKCISPKSFVGLTQLEKLYLQDNKLLSLGTEVFKAVPNIHHLDIRANVLETLTQETVQPFMDSLSNYTKLFFFEGNNFRCDTRLGWMFGLRNTTRSHAMRRNLEAVICYLEIGTLPPRLDDQTVTPAYETTTLGIGQMKELFALKESELPDPMRYMQTTIPGCDEEEEGTAGRPPSREEGEGDRRCGRGRGSGRKKAERNKTQNDMAAPLGENTDQEEGNSIALAPVQEESRCIVSGSPRVLSGSLVPVLILCFALIHCPALH